MKVCTYPTWSSYLPRYLIFKDATIRLETMCVNDRSWMIIGLLLFMIGYAISCYGGTPPSPDTPTTPSVKNKTTVKHSKNHTIDANVVLGGWPATTNLTKQWTSWLDDYKQKIADEKAAEAAMKAKMTQADKIKLEKERADWPGKWKDLGPGHSGEVPPPWAYAPKNTGLPDFCYQWPQRGDCEKNIKRWGYNSHENRCDEFIYSGCGENQNNFKDKLSCEKACMIPPVSGCDTESQILMDEDYYNVLEQ
ncbi:uncharacterized protein LOC115453498 [Manduca sexta]|uniref:BPTI/Kunitz inhibitor domain-containing protein n=1 Tax=Manduca sexta TaxID=7130 RepID=A0A922CZ33_MANSE|nr:uncharacterized protein LOC115453498 [Manduca sexta]KAG6465005.1 hypothetical protein O3G_MSEX014875 [Manduca sexta]